MTDSAHTDPLQGASSSRRARRYWVWLLRGYLLFAAVAFVILLVLVSRGPYFSFDLAVTRGLQQFQPAWFASLMVMVSWPGYSPEVYALVALIVAGLFMIRLRWEAVCALLAAAGGQFADTAVKAIVHRPRPSADLVTVVRDVNSYSYPSSHVVVYVAFLGFLIVLAYLLIKAHAVLRAGLIAVLAFLVVAVGVSRIYLGAHWLSDVIGGYFLGSLWLAGAIWLYRRRANASQPA